MDTAEILERAADEMQRRGKAEGEYLADDGSLCAVGAMRCAMGINPEVGFDGDSQITPAWNAMSSFIGGGSVADWNDDNDAPTVIAGLRAVAATLRAQSCRDLTAVTTDTRAFVPDCSL